MNQYTIRDAREAGRVAHPSTHTALIALKSLEVQAAPARVLDVGCGSGILTLAAAEYWPRAQCVACDISPQAVADATSNLAPLAGRVRVLRAEGVDHPEIAGAGPYGLIMCNLLADIHLRLAPALSPLLAPGGAVVLAGIMVWQGAQVRQAYEALGYEIQAEIEVSGWLAWVMARPAAALS